jgi:hypothetical protein
MGAHNRHVVVMLEWERFRNIVGRKREAAYDVRVIALTYSLSLYNPFT